MAQLTVMGQGNKDTGQNTIVPPIFAEMFRLMIGRDIGIIKRGFYTNINSDNEKKGVYDKPAEYGYNWNIIANSSYDITIDKGMAMIYGYTVYSDSIYSFSVQPPSSANKYVWVYVRVDLSNVAVADCTLDIMDKGSDNTWWLDAESDNLITNTNGRYILPLYRLEINPSGNIVAIVDYNALYVGTTTETPKRGGQNIAVIDIVERSNYANAAGILIDRQLGNSTSTAWQVGSQDKTKNISVDY